MSDLTVVVKRNSNTPTTAWEGYPDMFSPHRVTVNVSCVFTWDKPEAEKIAEAWRGWGCKVSVGGPAYDDPGGEFTPGKFTREGVVITHRGCVRQCPWCYVPKREGNKIREIEIKTGNVLQDNNILACSRSHQDKVFSMLATQRAIRFIGGLDTRLLTDYAIDRIRGLRVYDLWIAADSIGYRKSYLKAIEKLRTAGFSRKKIRCYVLIGYGKETQGQAEDRLREIYTAGALPFAQYYDQAANRPAWQLLIRRWSRPAATAIWMNNKESN